MKWITREHVKVDRVACPWLIRNFIDAAPVYDVPGCELGHHGEDVSFDSILKRHRLSDPALALLAEIVRAADSHPARPHPAGEGRRVA